MQNWRSYNNYRKRKNPDGTVTCFVTIDGKDIAVSKELYKEYAETGRRIRYMELDLKYDRVLQDADGKTVRDENGQAIVLPEREVSLDKLVDEGWDFPSSAPSAESVVVERFDMRTFYDLLDLLSPKDRALIQALFFENITEREYSQKTGLPQKTINDRKHRILGKLKNFLRKL